METKILILWCRAWSMVDESTGETRSGTSIQYVMTDKLVPFEADDKSFKGYPVSKESVSNECAKSIDAVPGIYDAEFGMKSSNGKNVLVVKSLTPAAPVNKEK